MVLCQYFLDQAVASSEGLSSTQDVISDLGLKTSGKTIGPQGPPLAICTVAAAPGSSPVFSGPSHLALHFIRGGYSSEGDLPYQRSSSTKTALIYLAF